MSPIRILENPAVPVIRIVKIPAVPVDRANKVLSKNEKGYKDNQEDIFYYENENTGNGRGRLLYHRLRQKNCQYVTKNGIQTTANVIK